MKALELRGRWAPRGGVESPRPGRRWSPNAHLAWADPSLHLVDAPLPAVGPGEVCVRVSHCGLCGTDVHATHAGPDGYVAFAGPMALPVLLGHEVSGEVVEVGPGVEGVSPGELVCVESILWCGACGPCRAGRPNQCARVELLGLTVAGGLSEYLTVPARLCSSLTPLLEAGLGAERAARLGALVEPLGCAWNGLFVALGGFKPGAFVAVVGAGPIGLGVVALARAAGAGRVLCVEPLPGRRALALRMGADAVADPDALGPGGVVGWLREETRGRGIDVAVEAAGVNVFSALVASAAPGGAILTLGRLAQRVGVDLNPVVSGGLRLVGARGHAGAGVFEHVIRLLAAERLPVEASITAEFGFGQVLEALDRARTGSEGKILVRVAGERPAGGMS